MARGISVHVGVDLVDAGHYRPMLARLQSAEKDALAMRDLAQSRNFGTTILLGEEAKVSLVQQQIAFAAVSLVAGDTFVLTYAGHGGSVGDSDDPDEGDRRDETWCLFDRQFFDDEVSLSLARFALGVRILVITDCCHSATSTRERSVAERTLVTAPLVRGVSWSVADQIHAHNRDLYDSIRGSIRRQLGRVSPGRTRASNSSLVRAAVIHVAACEDAELAADGPDHGAFTRALLQVWDEGAFDGDHVEFRDAILARFPVAGGQHPTIDVWGGSDAAFQGETPFTIR